MAYEGRIEITAANLEELAATIKRLASEYQALYTNDLYGTFENTMKQGYQGDDADAAITTLMLCTPLLTSTASISRMRLRHTSRLRQRTHRTQQVCLLTESEVNNHGIR